MIERALTKETVKKFHQHLINEEKGENTVKKYISDIKAFMLFAENSNVTKNWLLLTNKS